MKVGIVALGISKFFFLIIYMLFLKFSGAL